MYSKYPKFWSYQVTLVFIMLEVVVGAIWFRESEFEHKDFIISEGSEEVLSFNSLSSKCQKINVNSESFRQTSDQSLIQVNTSIYATLSILCDKMEYDPSAAAKFTAALKRRSWFIYPGTKWCGAGNESSSYDDLGKYAETDACCREHDHCDDTIVSGECHPVHRICNRAPVTRSSCACDDKLRQCLMNSKDEGATGVGYMFFNNLGIKCYRYDYPIKRCLEYGGFMNWHCQKYEYDKAKPKSWHFYDQPLFTDSSR